MGIQVGKQVCARPPSKCFTSNFLEYLCKVSHTHLQWIFIVPIFHHLWQDLLSLRQSSLDETRRSWAPSSLPYHTLLHTIASTFTFFSKRAKPASAAADSFRSSSLVLSGWKLFLKFSFCLFKLFAQRSMSLAIWNPEWFAQTAPLRVINLLWHRLNLAYSCQNKSTHYLLFLNHRTLDVVQLFPCIQCSKTPQLVCFTVWTLLINLIL